jgi:hypothetical protein
VEIITIQISKAAHAMKPTGKLGKVSPLTRTANFVIIMSNNVSEKSVMEICNLCKKDPCICPLELL